MPQVRSLWQNRNDRMLREHEEESLLHCRGRAVEIFKCKLIFNVGPRTKNDCKILYLFLFQ